MWKWFKKLWLDPEFGRKREFLRNVALFQDISRREFGVLFQTLVGRTYRPSEILFKEGDIGRALFIIESGEVEVSRLSPQDHHVRLAILKAGDYFGEMSIIDEQPRTATAVALDQVRVYLLYKAEMDKLLRRAPRIAASIMTHLATLLALRLRFSMQLAPFSLDSTDQTKRMSVVGGNE